PAPGHHGNAAWFRSEPDSSSARGTETCSVPVAGSRLKRCSPRVR
ncbi:hypothetical protein scyTo_0022855, partial [Scyliorhinus torazame]|nr:hypothetical protein [Scyliorhinus torazame]